MIHFKIYMLERVEDIHVITKQNQRYAHTQMIYYCSKTKGHAYMINRRDPVCLIYLFFQKLLLKCQLRKPI